jgi:hypothetical protein
LRIHVIVNFLETDSDKNKALFDARADARTAAVISSTVPSKEAFFSFFQSPGQQEEVKDGNQLAPPRCTLLKEV